MACIALLSMPGACSLDSALEQNSAAPYFIFELLRQVTVKCSRLYNQGLDQLNAFNNCISRNKNYRQDNASLLYDLGRVAGSIRRLNTRMQAWPHSVRSPVPNSSSLWALLMKIVVQCGQLEFSSQYGVRYSEVLWQLRHQCIRRRRKCGAK